MAGNTFRMSETVVIDTELEGVDTSISNVCIEIKSTVPASGVSGWTTYYPVAVSGTPMEEIGNQKYRYFWDTRVGYSGYFGWSCWSGYATASGVVYSGWTGISGYSAAVSGMYNVTITARDSNNHYGEEEFKIRIG